MAFAGDTLLLDGEVLFRSRVSLEAEILILCHQLNIQRRHVPKRVAFSDMDRLILVGLYPLVPNAIKVLTIVPVSDPVGAGNRGTAAAASGPKRKLLAQCSVCRLSAYAAATTG